MSSEPKATRQPSLQGIEVRHRSGCPNEHEKGKTRCRHCLLSFRFTAYDKRLKKVIRGKWDNNLAKVRRERLDKLREIEMGLTTDAPAVTFRAYAEDWMDKAEEGTIRNKKGEEYKPSLLRGYRSSLKQHVYPAIGTLRMTDIKRRDLKAMVESMQAKGKEGWTIRNAVNPIRSIYRHAIEHEVVTVNPTEGLSLPAGNRRKVVTEATGEKGEMVIRDAKGVVALIDALPEEDRLPFALAALAGLRRGEIRALRVGHIDFEANVIRVRLNRDGVGGDIPLKSDAGRRDVPILARLRPDLADGVGRLGLDAKSTDFAAPGPRGCLDADRYLNRCREVWKEKKLDALGLHDARHTFASLMIASGANLKQVSRIMGHSSINVTLDIYGHLLPGSEAEAGTKMDVYLNAVL